MRYLKSFFLAAMMAAALGVASVTASAETSLPSVLFLPGTTEGSLKAESATAKTKFTGIQNLTGLGYKFTISGSDMAELGTGEADFTNTALGAKHCNTPGDAAGTVLNKGEAHFALGLAGEFLSIILLPAGGVKIECEGVSITVTGSQEDKSTSVGGTESTTVEGETGACTGSTPAFSEYDNMSGTMSKVELKSEVGGIKAKSCEEIEGKVIFTASADAEVMEP